MSDRTWRSRDHPRWPLEHHFGRPRGRLGSTDDRSGPHIRRQSADRAIITLRHSLSCWPRTLARQAKPMPKISSRDRIVPRLRDTAPNSRTSDVPHLVLRVSYG